MISDSALVAIKDRNPVHDVAGDMVKLRRKGRAAKFVGPCPICSEDSQSKDATRFECDAESWVCAVCQDGGDVIKLIMKAHRVDFRAAVDLLGGAAEAVPTPEMANKAGRAAYRKALIKTAPLDVPEPYAADVALRRAWGAGWRAAAKAESDAIEFRERERVKLWHAWRSADWYDDVYHGYFAKRGLLVPDGCDNFKFKPQWAFYASGNSDPIHVGPALFTWIKGPIEGRGIVFRGLHMTWLDLSKPKGKAEIQDPATGELLPAKKVRGSKAGAWVDLGPCDPDTADTMIAGEGIETTLAVHTYLRKRGRDLSRVAFRVGLDLGNLCGSARDTVRHPTLVDAAGRARRVPGPDPDLDSAAMPVPFNVRTLIGLGDGDSDPFTTHNAMARFAARNCAPGRSVSVQFSPQGTDFDDLIKTMEMQ